MDTWITKINSVVEFLKQKKLYTLIAVAGVLVLVGVSPWLFRGLLFVGVFLLNAKLNRIENKIGSKK